MFNRKKRKVLTQIIDAANDIHILLGSHSEKGLYNAALAYELEKQGLSVKKEQSIYMLAKNGVHRTIKVDLIVEDMIIVLTQTEEKLSPDHKKRAFSFVKLTGKETGLVINFREKNMKKGITRVDVGIRP